MRCPECGHESFDLCETCEHCGGPPGATAAAPGVPPIDPADDLLGLRLEPERFAPGHMVPDRECRRTTPGRRTDRGGDFAARLDDDGLPFRIDDDFDSGRDPGAPEGPDPMSDVPPIDQGGFRPAAVPGLTGAAFAFAAEEPGTEAEAGGKPIIERDEEVPERYWAPEVAGLGRRALALLVDQSLLLAVLGIFFLGAFLALRLNGLDTGLFLTAAVFQASALPFALLAAVLSLAYHIYFHGSAGRTPGKALVGIEVRTGDGGDLTWGRVILRGLGAVLGLGCAGVGIIWALFEPRRRGWADLISGTVVARPRREPAVDGSRH